MGTSSMVWSFTSAWVPASLAKTLTTLSSGSSPTRKRTVVIAPEAADML
jgi:hypothetical protein